ncbi:MAG: hypothetical protein AMXMBFR64_44820 [Myxococcales bacterium]
MRTASWILLVALFGCGDSDSSGGSAAGGTGLPGDNGFTQPGAQDFGEFRKILEDGKIPGPDTLDPLGFFAEHKLDYPAADCGANVCAHTMMAVADNLLTGSAATVLQLGLNSPLTPDTLDRPPLNLVLSVDLSGSMEGEPIEALRSGLTRMLEYLEPEDRISLVGWSDEAEVIFEWLGLEEKAAIQAAILDLKPRAATNIYDGLFTAYQVASAHMDPARQNRVVLLSDGVATSGIKSPVKIKSLAAGWAAEGIATTTIGVGTAFDATIMSGVAEVGAGAYYFLEDPLAVKEVFTEEVLTFLVPAALDVRIDVSMAEGYDIQEVYGTNGWVGAASGGTIEIPALFLAGRKTSVEPVEGGRRGGGGAILFKLAPRKKAKKLDEPNQVASVALQWVDPATGDPQQQLLAVDNPNEPGVVPSGGWFSTKTVEKAFVMLNIYAGLKLACTSAGAGSPEVARTVLTDLRARVTAWNETWLDPDISADVAVIDKFLANLGAVTTDIKQPVPSNWLWY